jgi:membrane protease YdiL (CAAX protease family)
LLTAAGVELVRIVAVKWLWPFAPLYLLVPLLLAMALVAVRFVAGVTMSQIGFRPWRAWSLTEKSYFLQVILIANLVFPLVFAAPLRNRIGTSGVASTLSGVFVPYLVFGFYQEVVCRGMVQTELSRRWGAVAGVLVANVIYTFGPLHWVYFWSPMRSALPMFLAVFLIGLFFGIVFARSGNLWLVSVFHAIGNAYILASLAPGASGTG